MSIKNRKIKYFSIEFLDSMKNKSFDKDVFSDFLSYIVSLKESERIIKNDTKKKATELFSVDKYEQSGNIILQIVFKSCKYNHFPEYMSIIDGSERPSDKKPHEGDKELTHMCIKISENEALAMLEIRQSGVSMKQIIEYLNPKFTKYAEDNGLPSDRVLLWGYVPAESFLDALKKVKRISLAELYTEKELIGGEFFDLMDIDDNIQDDLIITIKSKRKRTISVNSIQTAFNRMIAHDSKTTRIRLYGQDNNKLGIVLDSINGQKKEEITVELNDNGTVNTFSIFTKMRDTLLGIRNEVK